MFDWLICGEFKDFWVRIDLSTSLGTSGSCFGFGLTFIWIDLRFAFEFGSIWACLERVWI